MPRRKTREPEALPRCPHCRAELRHLTVTVHRLLSVREEWFSGAGAWRRQPSANVEEPIETRQYYCFACGTRLTDELHEWAKATLRAAAAAEPESPPESQKEP